MGSTDDTPLLPGDWGNVDQERTRILDARRRQAQHDQARSLVGEFEEWMQELEDEPDEISATSRTVRELLRLKDEELDSPDPLDWSEEMITQLVTEVVPRRKPAGLNAPKDAARDLLQFVTFLQSAKRWRKSFVDGERMRMRLIHLAHPDPEDWGPGIRLT